MGMENLVGQMVKFIKDIGRMASSMVEVHISCQIVLKEKENGLKEKK